MWIKWKYNDHGWPDFAELEVPDNMGGYETLEEYLIDHCSLPTWSERYDSRRIKWEKLNLPPEEERKRKMKRLSDEIKYHEYMLNTLRMELDYEHMSLKNQLF